MKRYIIHIFLIVSDVCFLTMMYYIVGWLRHLLEKIGMPPFSLYSEEDFILVLTLMLIILWYEKIYTYRFDFWEETKRSVKAFLLTMGIVLAFLMLNRSDISYSRSFIMMYFVLVIVLFPIFKRSIKMFLFKICSLRKKVKIIGHEEQSRILREELTYNWYLGMESVEDEHDAIFIATKEIPLNELNIYLNTYMKQTKDIYLLPYIEKVNFTEANMIEYFNIRTSVIHIENELLKWHNIFIKEIFEKSITLLCMPVVLLLHAFIAYKIRIDSKGSIFFKQERLGKNSQSFICYKYRTMHENGDEILTEYLKNHPEEVEYYSLYHKYQNDPRITSFGQFLRKTSLDELPQVFNIFLGQMSLVGPRPYMVEERVKLGEDSETILWVKPGLTGLWQVSGRNNLTFGKRKELDIWYIQNWSLWIDFIILVKTVKVVLFKKGAS